MVQTAQRFLYLSFTLCLTVACTATQRPVMSSATPTSSAKTAVSPINQLAQEFQKLRPVTSQFNGGTWNAAVDEWMGEKHSLMLTLQEHVESNSIGKPELILLMGQPDNIATGGDLLFEQLVNGLTDKTAVSPKDELLIYEWRGTNDFLFFVSREGSIVHSSWWHAGE